MAFDNVISHIALETDRIKDGLADRLRDRVNYRVASEYGNKDLWFQEQFLILKNV